MLESSDLVAFVGVSDLEQARQFYAGTLGLTLRDEAPFALVAEVRGTMLRITAVAAVTPVAHTVLGWRCRPRRRSDRDDRKALSDLQTT